MGLVIQEPGLQPTPSNRPSIHWMQLTEPRGMLMRCWLDSPAAAGDLLLTVAVSASHFGACQAWAEAVRLVYLVEASTP